MVELIRFIHDKMYVDRGDGASDDFDLDKNVKPLRALLARYSNAPYPLPPSPTPDWEL
jgi:hypothetical protein